MGIFIFFSEFSLFRLSTFKSSCRVLFWKVGMALLAAAWNGGRSFVTRARRCLPGARTLSTVAVKDYGSEDDALQQDERRSGAARRDEASDMGNWFRICRIIRGLGLTSMAGEKVNLSSEDAFHGEETSDDEGRQKPQDVFLCHSGKQKNFVRQLHIDLIRADVSCFFDEDLQSLPLAHKFPSRIFQATESCKVAVLILSEQFFQSRWPMLELELHAFLTNIRSDYPQWQELERSEEIRAEWQNAVREVRAINGLRFSEGENKVSFREKVVNNIDSLLRQSPILQPPPPRLQQAPKRKVLPLIPENLFVTTAHRSMLCYLLSFLQQVCSSARCYMSIFGKFQQLEVQNAMLQDGFCFNAQLLILQQK